MVFADRIEAGRLLAQKLMKYEGHAHAIVLGIPRGGVAVAFEVAEKLRLPLDVFISRKLGVPGQEELALGAIASGGVRVLNADVAEVLGVPEQEINRIAAQQQRELERRERVYRGHRPPLQVRGKTTILVDDGIATGSSILAAITALRELKPARIVVAVPVAPRLAFQRLEKEVDEVYSVEIEEAFYAIGQFYLDFSPTSDEEVCELLRRGEQPAIREVA
jgi:putative phosphoribosyl transferase